MGTLKTGYFDSIFPYCSSVSGGGGGSQPPQQPNKRQPGDSPRTTKQTGMSLLSRMFTAHPDSDRWSSSILKWLRHNRTTSGHLLFEFAPLNLPKKYYISRPSESYFFLYLITSIYINFFVCLGGAANQWDNGVFMLTSKYHTIHRDTWKNQCHRVLNNKRYL